MKLTAYLIEGQPVISQVFTWNKTEIGENQPILCEDTVTVGYEDISSIENWHKFGTCINKDYKFIRNEIMTLVWTKMMGDPNNWILLTDIEKLIAAEWFVVPKELRDTVYNIEEQIAFAEIFDMNSVISRDIRHKKAKYELYNRLNFNDANEVLNEIEKSVSLLTHNLRESYIYYGREGLLEGDPEGLFDYFRSQVGSSFENNGFLDHTYIIEGYSTIQEFSVKLLDILKNGNY